jgi:hypothetical protein
VRFIPLFSVATYFFLLLMLLACADRVDEQNKDIHHRVSAHCDKTNNVFA